MKDLILSVDCGTQSLRTFLFDSKGKMVAFSKIDYEPYSSPRPGWAEQDPEIYWMAFLKSLENLKDQVDNFQIRIAAITVTTLSDTMINVDKDGNALRPAILWLDQRKNFINLRKRSFLTHLSHILVNMDEPFRILQSESKVDWIRNHQPDVWKKTEKFLQVSGFFNFRLTGKFVDSTASQIGHIPFDYKKKRWSSKGDISYMLFYVEPEKLPDLVDPTTIIGRITSQAAVQTGLIEGTPVIASGSDKGCESVGTGCVENDKANISLGTMASIQITSKKYFEPIRFMPAYPSVIPNYYNPSVSIFRGFWMITWFKNEFGFKERLDAEKLGIFEENLLDEMISKVPPGSLGLISQPYWGPGLKMPEAKGAFIGFGEAHTRAHMYRAMIEGIGYALLEGLIKIERRGNLKVRSLTISGGGSKSNDICQIFADIFGLPVEKGAINEAAGLGAAIVASVGIGMHKDFDAATKEMVKYSQKFLPNDSNHELYQKLFKVYGEMYSRLKKLYEDIRKITNYPETR